MDAPRSTPPSIGRTTLLGGWGSSRCLLASIAAGGLLLTGCGAFHIQLPTSSRRARGSGGSYRPDGTCCTHATRLPQPVSAVETTVTDAEADTSAVLNDLARGDINWEGHEFGFDWYLEKARRGMTGAGGFSPLRMSFWRPTEEVEELSFWDSAYIIMRNLGQMVGLPSADNAPVAEIQKYTGSWLTFLQKVSNGRLEDLAGGPLFLMLEKYFQAEGVCVARAGGERGGILDDGTHPDADYSCLCFELFLLCVMTQTLRLRGSGGG